MKARLYMGRSLKYYVYKLAFWNEGENKFLWSFYHGNCSEYERTIIDAKSNSCLADWKYGFDI